MNIREIIGYLDSFLTKNGRKSIDPVEANALLAKAGLLRDSRDRPGKPLRDLLRKGLLPHAYQPGGKGSSWVIPHSKGINKARIINPPLSATKPIVSVFQKTTATGDINTESEKVRMKLERARLRYKPDSVKYVLVAEAPPDSLERFFYFEEVRKHDYLFLGVAQALYPDLKEKFLLSGRSSDIKKQILDKFKGDGFYLLDLSDLPLSILSKPLESQLPLLIEKLRSLVQEDTKIILIKANVYDIAFPALKDVYFDNIIDVRIPFPGQGSQKRFQIEFKIALELAGHL